MKKPIFLFFAIFVSIIAVCQIKCSDLIKNVSKEWKRDSLTKTGYRSNAYKQLRQCLADSLTATELVKYLGKPAKIQKFYSGNSNRNYVQYEYFYWDSYTIPNEKPFERL